jgi:hypothetical protein
MSEVLAGNYNFSKIGKYISNKLHHIHSSKKSPPRPFLAPPLHSPPEDRS